MGKNIKRKILKIFLVIVVILGFFSFMTLISLKKAITSTQKVANAAKSQDLDATKAYLKGAKNDFTSTKRWIFFLTPLRIIPIAGWYVADIQRGVDAAIYGLNAAQTLTDAVTPYADVLGLKGKGTFLGGTAQERLASVIDTLSKVTPQLDSVGQDLGKARLQIDKIQAWRYPDILPGKPGTKIKNAKNAIDQIETFVVDTRPLIDVLPKIMGQDKEKKYLILFQNDKELRPTGGFITAYAVFRVNKGTLTSEGSNDIYELDNTLLKRIPAPAPIINYLPNVPTLNLRDSNLSPDYLSSMTLFEELYEATSAKKEIDGIIALDTEFVLNLMEVLGPIEAYGTKFTKDKVDACDCPQIIYELEKFADQPVAYEKGSRKGIIGVLMQQMMDKAFNAPKSTWPNLLGTTI